MLFSSSLRTGTGDLFDWLFQLASPSVIRGRFAEYDAWHKERYKISTSPCVRPHTCIVWDSAIFQQAGRCCMTSTNHVGGKCHRSIYTSYRTCVCAYAKSSKRLVWLYRTDTAHTHRYPINMNKHTERESYNV